MSCPCIPRCELYVEFSSRPSLGLWKEYYCESDFSRCRRFSCLDAGQVPPPNMLPSGKLLHHGAATVKR
jgi:hypothetical protein